MLMEYPSVFECGEEFYLIVGLLRIEEDEEDEVFTTYRTEI